MKVNFKFDDAVKVENQKVSKKVQVTVRKSRGVRRTHLRCSDFEMRRNAEIGLFAEPSNLDNRSLRSDHEKRRDGRL
jgi:hypothetical protein